MTRHVTRLTKFPATVIAAVVLAASPRPGLAQDAAAPAASAPPTVAEAAPARPEVVVSASRLLDGVTGSSTTVIASERIKRSPASTLPELLSLEAGIQARDLFGGTGASRANIDMRGFGAVGAQNALILIDGRRLNDIDLAAIDYASIPLDSIDRIEIIRGSAGAVLYGDGAVGGVVNIVTKSATDTTTGGAADIAIGSEVYREANVSGRTTVGRFSMNAYGSAIESKGYRANNDLRQKNALAELRHRGDGGDVFVKFQADNQRLGLPGGRRETLGTSELHPDFVRRLAIVAADDVVFRKRNLDPLYGKEAVHKDITELLAGIQGMSHKLTRTLVDGNTVVVVGEVTYTRQDGSTLTSQFADVWTMSGNKIQEYLIFIDNTEL